MKHIKHADWRAGERHSNLARSGANAAGRLNAVTERGNTIRNAEIRFRMEMTVPKDPKIGFGSR
eukprot:6198795-Pleurochrysis_carterae.AAC.1